MDDLTDWLGNSEERHDQIVAFPANALSATLNHDTQYVDGSSLPPLWHWLYFLPIYRLDQANYDGHAALGGFLPPVKLPRRMWAGSRVSFLNDLVIGQGARLCAAKNDERTAESGPSRRISRGPRDYIRFE